MIILQVSAFYPQHGGGIEAVAGHLAKNHEANGHQVIWMAGDDPSHCEEYNFGNIRTDPAQYWDPLESSFGLPCPIWSLSSCFRLWKNIKQADIVHLHDYLYMPCLAAMLFARFLKVPLIITQHIGELPLRSRILSRIVSTFNATIGKIALSRADKVIFVASPVRDYFESFVQFRTEPSVIANGVDCDIYRSFSDVVPISNENDSVRLLFVGRFVEKKGMLLLHECMDIPAVEWTFVGRGPLSPKNWKNLPRSTRVMEGLSPKQIANMYQQADLLVLPSVGEGFPLVVQESLACGTPVLVSTDVASAFPITDESCVYSVDVRGAHAASHLRQALISLINKRQMLARARPAATLLSKQWSWRACALKYEDAYRSIVHCGN